MNGYSISKLRTRLAFKHVLLFVLFFLPLFKQLFSQQKMAGVYNLNGVMETASGFKLNKDSSFEFYFSYGALDRYGGGTWKLRDGQVIFTSKPWPGKDFKLVSSGAAPANQITARISAKNTMLLQYVNFTLYSNGKALSHAADSKGFVNFTKQKVDSLILQFEFVPERKSVFTGLIPGHNYFEFSFEPWLVEVFFNEFKLLYNEGNLEGKHPLLGGENYVYLKE